MIALGPAATVLAYDLSQRGLQAIDIGHIDIEYEWYKMKATDKVAIKNKDVQEVIGGMNVSQELDSVYTSQIVTIL